MAGVSIGFEIDVEKISPIDGDIIVMTFPAKTVTPETAIRIGDALEEACKLAGIQVYAIVGDQGTITAIERVSEEKMAELGWVRKQAEEVSDE